MLARCNNQGQQMKIKVNLFDNNLITKYSSILSVISTLCSFVLIVITVPDDANIRIAIGGIMLTVLLGIYVVMWFRANTLNNVSLEINNSTVVVKFGDIFEENELKVIAFNEYFDTQVDNKIIADSSLNGIYIKTKVNDISELDNRIDTDINLNNKAIKNNSSRICGKQKIYKLGTIFKNDDYLLTAFTKFDDDNRAYLSMPDYINFLLNFWNEIDIIYAGRSVSIPLLGSGITRFKEYNAISEQELLELLIWSFKVSKIKFTYPSKVSIVIHESKKDKINLYKLKRS